MELDASLYPDLEAPPQELTDPADKADYLHRVCSAMDFWIFPEPATLKLLAGWKDIFDRYPLPASPAYRTLRAMYGWPRVPMPEGLPALRPPYLAMDAAEGRGPDPCESMV
jgi:hypothetical protein